MRWLALLGLVACDGSDSSGMVTVRLPRAPGAIVVYRDGNSAWTATTGAAGSVRFPAPSGMYTVVVGCNHDQVGRATVYAMTTDELATIDFQSECGGETQVINGQLVGVTSGTALVHWGLNIIELVNGPSFTLDVPRGTGDLLVSLGGRVSVVHDVSVGAAPASVTVDLSAPPGGDVQQRRVALSAVDERDMQTYVALWTRNGTYASLCSNAGSLACALPTTVLAPEDLHMGRVETVGSPYRAARWAVHEVIDREIVLPAAMSSSPPEVTIKDQAATVAVSVTWPGAPSAPLYRLSAFQASAPPYRYWQIVASEGFVSSGVNLSLPDLSGVAGWDAGIDLIAGNFVEWVLAAETGATLDELARSLPSREGTVFEDGFRGSSTPLPP